jgi:protein-disulfide isomerase
MSSHIEPLVNSNDHISGDNNASLELVEYGDYECPSCGHAYPIIKAIQKKLKGNLKFVFRNFPLSEMHPHAFKAAVATEAAALQGKFWEMHDIIFENQARLSPDALLKYAQRIGLDVNRFKEDIQKKSLSDKVENDFESGVRSGVNGTPGFFINEYKYNGPWGEEEYLTNHLQSILNKA